MENAYYYYELRSTMPGWAEENFMTVYRWAQIVQRMNELYEDDYWPEALALYLEAYALRPHRVEPLIKIAEYYRSIDSNRLSFFFGQQALKVEYPSDDVLFVDKYLYDFVRYDMLSQAAWWIGEYDEGQQALEQILELYPDKAYLHRNMEFYLKRE